MRILTNRDTWPFQWFIQLFRGRHAVKSIFVIHALFFSCSHVNSIHILVFRRKQIWFPSVLLLFWTGLPVGSTTTTTTAVIRNKVNYFCSWTAKSEPIWEWASRIFIFLRSTWARQFQGCIQKSSGQMWFRWPYPCRIKWPSCTTIN